MTKLDQLKKSKKPNKKRMPKMELISYKDDILDRCYGLCQICGSKADDMHHAYYGRQGADKDDRKLVALCRECHTKCHQSKHGALNAKAKEIATMNWRVYNG